MATSKCIVHKAILLTDQMSAGFEYLDSYIEKFRRHDTGEFLFNFLQYEIDELELP